MPDCETCGEWHHEAFDGSPLHECPPEWTVVFEEDGGEMRVRAVRPEFAAEEAVKQYDQENHWHVLKGGCMIVVVGDKRYKVEGEQRHLLVP